MSWTSDRAARKQEVAAAFKTGKPLLNNNTRREREQAAKAERRQRDHETAIGHRRAGRAK
jgi:hypothetical protein